MTVGALSTGLPVLDRLLDGGIPAGSVVAVVAPAGATSEPLLYALASGGERARYLTTLRPAGPVEAALDRHGVTAEVRAVEGDALLAAPTDHLGGLDRSVVVVDPVTEVEQGERTAYRDFLEAVGRACRMTDSVAVFHCVETTPATLRRDLTLASADLVLDLDLHAHPDGVVQPVVTVTRARGCPLPDTQVGLQIDADGATAHRLDKTTQTAPGEVDTEAAGTAPDADVSVDPEPSEPATNPAADSDSDSDPGSEADPDA